MKLAFYTLLILSYLSVAMALFWAGNKQYYSEQLVQRTDSFKFEQNKCRYLHFNTCREYNFIIDRAEVETQSGKNLIGKLVHGGEEDFYFVIEICGEGQATYETTVWGHFRGIKTFIDESKVFLTFDQYWPCNHAVAVY